MRVNLSDDGGVADDRRQLRTTFDAVADSYQRAWPEYPELLYDALVEAAGIKVGGQLLEIGCATGKATIPLARRGLRITGIEIGPKRPLRLGATSRSSVTWKSSSARSRLRPPSGHIAMEASNRDRLYAEIRRRLAQRPDGRLRRHWGAVLQAGRRTDRYRSTVS